MLDTLRRRDQQYRLLAEQAADGVLLVGSDGRLADASPGAAVLLARPRAQLLRAAARRARRGRQGRRRHGEALLALRPGSASTRSFRLRRAEGRAARDRDQRAAARRRPAAAGAARHRRAAPRGRRAPRERGALRAARGAGARRDRDRGGGPRGAREPGAAEDAGAAALGSASPGARSATSCIPTSGPRWRARGRGRVAAGPAGVRLASRLRRADGSTAEVEGAAGLVTYRGRPAVQLVLREVKDERPAARPTSTGTRSPASRAR